ncbi:MAG TPA: sigma factor-like helix-turn-helix DNA-binding protein, partial [Acidimicrobiia bacterium]|nr:sigma factor-like helix-turn-helix DNA-binding protein [Acidimicrobiia bacterium]
HRRLVGHQRQTARRRTDPVGDDLLDARPAADDPAESGVAAVATQQAVDRLVACLPADQAEVVLLRVVAGLPADEVGRITKRSAGAVRVLQHRALRRLAREFSDLAVTP